MRERIGSREGFPRKKTGIDKGLLSPSFDLGVTPPL